MTAMDATKEIKDPKAANLIAGFFNPPFDFNKGSYCIARHCVHRSVRETKFLYIETNASKGGGVTNFPLIASATSSLVRSAIIKS